MEIIKNNPYLTASEIASMLKVTRQTVNNQMKSLKENGVIVRIGSDKTGHWEVKD